MAIDYKMRLKELVARNTMYEYEDIYSDYSFVQYVKISNEEMGIVIRADKITAQVIWHIRYIKSLGVSPQYILTTKGVKDSQKSIYGIPLITYEELYHMNTSKFLLLIVNRESDFGECTQIDYREDSFDFIMRERAIMSFYRERSAENFYEIYNELDKYELVLDLLEDQESKECLVEIIRCLVENDIYRKKQGSQEEKYFDQSIYKLGKGKWINCGAATGDTLLKFANNNKICSEIIAVDVDEKIMPKLIFVKELLEKYTDCKVKICNRILKKGESSIDKLFEDDKIALINMDVEGAEMMILESAENTIKKKAPVIAVCAYHKAEDLIEIPNYIKRINEDYHFYLRKYRGCSPDAINEYVYYAVPTSQMVIMEK